jgi:hypothetical protein
MQDTEILDLPQAPAQPCATPAPALKPDFNPLVSYFPNAYENLPTDIPAAQFIASIKGNQHKSLVETIRKRFKTALDRGVPYEKAKRTVDANKKKLPCVSFAGILPMRDKNATPQFTGLLQADLDLLGDRLPEIRATLHDDPHLYSLYDSPTGEGLKAIYRVPICKSADEYKLVFAAVSSRVEDLTGVCIDKLEDFTRLCFASYDSDIYLNPQAIELPVDFSRPAETAPPPPPPASSRNHAPLSRRAIAERILGTVGWQTDVLGDCRCPGEAHHTTGGKSHECQVHLDGAPTVHCVHKSCASAVAEANRLLRSEIGKAEKPAAPNSNRADIAGGYFDEQPDASQPRPVAKPPEAKSLGELKCRTLDDPNELLKTGYLCRGAGLLLAAPTGIGKTTLGIQAAILLGLGRPVFGITPTRPLRSLYIQAENDEGDLAEMRDGIIAGLKLTKEETKMAMQNVMVVHENSRTGRAFMENTVAPLLELHRPDLLWIDPALAYIGSDAMTQKDVGYFLRNLLNPILTKFKCGCVVIHHTNKPSKGEEKSAWQAGDYAYLGSGSAEWANWARAVLAIRSLGSHDVFELRAGKRGARIGWKGDDGKTTYTQLIGHAPEPDLIYWRTATEDETPAGAPRRQGTREDLTALVPLDKPIAKSLLIDQWRDRYGNHQKGRAFLDALIADEKLFEWRLNRSGTNAAKLIARKPQPDKLKTDTFQETFQETFQTLISEKSDQRDTFQIPLKGIEMSVSRPSRDSASQV